jgi:hypothetical protein
MEVPTATQVAREWQDTVSKPLSLEPGGMTTPGSSFHPVPFQCTTKTTEGPTNGFQRPLLQTSL